MAPTLQDVSYLLGLPLAGQPIGPLDALASWSTNMAQRFEGITAVPFDHDEHGPKFDWLLGFQIQRLGYPELQLTEPQITRCLEAYLLWLLGKVMFTENHVTTITARYIPIALEIANATSADMITQRSWGSAVLAATYREMTCVLWQRCFSHAQVRGCYPAFSEQFDVLLASSVMWEPYTDEAIGARFRKDGDDVEAVTLISTLCTKDAAYWLTKSKIIFDMQVVKEGKQQDRHRLAP
uniref:Uncharacterized protein n=1 Tax=Avena sativa TaxID=4498 RepID=A0ACD5VBT6_AVESA